MNRRSRIRLVCIDDHPLFRSGLKSLFAAEADIEVVGEADNGTDGLNIIGQAQPDIVLLDIGIPGISGLEVCRQIRQRYPSVKVIMLTMHRERAHLLKAFHAGARGFVLKQGGVDELLLGIRAVHTGKKYICSDLAESVLERFTKKPAEKTEDDRAELSDREAEIVRLVCQGWDNQRIAEALYISPATVKTHRARIMRKLGIHSSTELVKYALKTGIIELE